MGKEGWVERLGQSKTERVAGQVSNSHSDTAALRPTHSSLSGSTSHPLPRACPALPLTLSPSPNLCPSLTSEASQLILALAAPIPELHLCFVSS
jgi:hypothetical protein